MPTILKEKSANLISHLQQHLQLTSISKISKRIKNKLEYNLQLEYN